jgi:hypothetical protein
MTKQHDSVQLPIPDRVEVVGDELWTQKTAPKTYRRARAATFYDFTQINPADNEAIRQFAKKWGLLALCPLHRCPVSHCVVLRQYVDESFPGPPTSLPSGPPPCSPKTVSRKTMLRVGFEPGIEFFSEPLNGWRGVIQKAGAIRRLGVEIREGGKGRIEDWLTLEDRRIKEPEPAWMQGLSDPVRSRLKSRLGAQEPWKYADLARDLLANHVGFWLHLADLRPYFHWDSTQSRWAVHHLAPAVPDTWPLFSWLARRLMIEISVGRVVVCPYCQNEYFPDRLPSPRQNHCCQKPDCKRKYFAAYRRKQRANGEQSG